MDGRPPGFRILKKVRIYSAFAANVFHRLGFDVRPSDDGNSFIVFYESAC